MLRGLWGSQLPLTRILLPRTLPVRRLVKGSVNGFSNSSAALRFRLHRRRKADDGMMRVWKEEEEVGRPLLQATITPPNAPPRKHGPYAGNINTRILRPVRD